jgi:hypothetical protein
MPKRARNTVSRRAALTGFAISVACGSATTTRPSDAYLAPGKALPAFGHGYLLWLLPGVRRRFALLGANGQSICIDPTSKLILVQTAVENNYEVWRLWSALVEQFGQG